MDSRERTSWHHTPVVKAMLLSQLLVTACVGLVALVWGGDEGWNWELASAVALGGFFCVIPTVFSGRRVFAASVDRNHHGREHGSGAAPASAHAALMTLYRASVSKIALATALFVAAFSLAETINFVAVCAAFAVVQVSSSLIALASSAAAHR